MLRLNSPGYDRLFQSPTLEATFGGGEANVTVSLATTVLQQSPMQRLLSNLQSAHPASSTPSTVTSTSLVLMKLKSSSSATVQDALRDKHKTKNYVTASGSHVFYAII